MQTAFLGQAYASRSPILASQTAVNIYPEMTETKGSDVAGFFGTPGLLSMYLGSGEVRGLWDAAEGDYRYAVIGPNVYQFDANWNGHFLGTLPNDSGRVSMIDNGVQLGIAHQDGWHYVTLGGTSIQPVVNSPPGTSILANTDEYVLFTENTGGSWGITQLADLSSINPLDVATAEGAPDNLVAITTLHREAWLFGTTSTEIWDDSGNALFPFSISAFLDVGCAAKFSVAKTDDAIFWLGRDKNGRGMVYRGLPYNATRVSTHAIEEAIASYSTIGDAIAWTYQEEGHYFYVLTFPTGDATWVLDTHAPPELGWHRRGWLGSDGTFHRHRANCYANFNGMHVVGDYNNGKVYQSSTLLTDDDGSPVYRERAWEQPLNEHNRTRTDTLELVALMGDGDGAGDAPIVWLQLSKDAGQTWGYERYQKLGRIGKRKARARWRRLGIGRDIVYRVATTMKGRVSWVAAIAGGEEMVR